MRKCLLLVLLMFTSALALAQQPHLNSGSIEIKQLPSEGIPLNEGWKVQTEDNPAFAAPDYNDKEWPAVNIGQPSSAFLQKSKGGVVWLRLHFTLASAGLSAKYLFS
jgi:hypothetical protein